MLIGTMFARDMYQVYKINDDWYKQSANEPPKKHLRWKTTKQQTVLLVERNLTHYYVRSEAQHSLF